MNAMAIADHLWQSTLFGVAAALLACALRTNGAELRYWIWLTASAKFAIPFAVLAAAGEALGSRFAAPAADAMVTLVLGAVSEPFSRAALATGAPVATPAGVPSVPAASMLAALWLAGCLALVAAWCTRWRRAASILRAATALTAGREVALLRQLEAASGQRSPLPMAASSSALEPAVFGIVRPVLLWPRGISRHLTDAQIRTILAHELAHVRRRDNLTAALHMAVQAVFWFHPLVWWIGARLVHERERACDERVLRSGGEPHVYAESILKTCRFSIESPLACVAGVTGADLAQRIEGIMRSHTGNALSARKKLCLLALGAATVIGPIVSGGVNARPLPSRVTAAAAEPFAFEVASVKPNTSGDNRVMVGIQPGGRFTATNMAARELIANAYDMQSFRIEGGPAWIGSDRYDIQAQAAAGSDLDQDRVSPMLRALLADRFKLAARVDTREMPVYALVLARGDRRLGPSVSPAAVDCAALAAARRAGAPAPAPPPAGGRRQCGVWMTPGSMQVGGTPMRVLARALSEQLGRVVIDQTNCRGASI